MPNQNSDSFILISDENKNEHFPIPENAGSTFFSNFTPSKFVHMSGSVGFSEIMGRIFNVKNWITKASSKLRPWSEFFQITKVNKPKNVSFWLSRIYRNLFYFQNNYIVLFLALLAYCLFTNPLLLLILAAWCVIWWIVTYKSVDGEIKIIGHVLGVKEIVGISTFASLPLLYFAGVGSMFFWLIGVTIVVVGIHASFIDFEGTSDDIPMSEFSNEV